MSHTEEIRKQCLEYVSNGGKILEALKIFNVSRSSFQRWRKLKSETGSIAIRPRVVEPYKINNDELITYVKNNPDAYVIEIADHFNVTKGCISTALKRLKISRKKKAFYTRNVMIKIEKYLLKNLRAYLLKPLYLLTNQALISL